MHSLIVKLVFISYASLNKQFRLKKKTYLEIINKQNKTNPKSCRAAARIVDVFPVPGGP